MTMQSAHYRRILGRLSRAIDRAIVRGIPTHQDAWCRAWAAALERAQRPK